MVRIVRQSKEIARCWQLREKLKCARSADATTFRSTTEAHMPSEQVALVQSSFKSVVPIASKAADLFCGRLFEIAPLRAWIKWSATQAR